MIRVKIANPQDLLPSITPGCAETARLVLEGEALAEAQISLAFVDNPRFTASTSNFSITTSPPTCCRSDERAESQVHGMRNRDRSGVAKAQAAERGHDVSAELGLYAIHGLLHLCGYDDHDEREVKEMRDRERHYLRVLNYPDISEH